MGRTRRKRKKRQTCKELELRKVIPLQRALRLKCRKIQINYFDGIGWGVRCKKKIDKGEILIALPLHHLITANVHCGIFNVLTFKNQSPQFILSIFIIYESHLKEKSRYFQYLESLPKTFTNPYFCNREELKVLPECIRNEVNSQVTYLNSQLEELQIIVNDKSCLHCGEKLKNILTSEQFVWAWFIVNTRSVYFQDEKRTNSLALAPFLDLFNHSNDANTKLFIDLKNGLYILRTFISYKKFEQVFIKYGAHNNLKLFLEYGFILPNNDNDFVEFCFNEILECVREFDCNFGEIPKLKYNFIKSNKLDQNLIKTTEFSWNFHGLVYVLITTDEDISVLQAKTYSNSFSSEENVIIQKIFDIVSRKKASELNENLAKMETVENCTASFSIAKNLIKTYMKLLQ